ncbi:MAG: YiiX family permuted papain-like enzyme [Deltaproteobacteria bacterium]
MLVVAGGCGDSRAEGLRDGDIIFQTSRSSQSLAIQQATHSKYSHMGIIFLRNGKPYVYEAAKTVRYTPLKEWISHGVGGHYVVKRLRRAGIAPDFDAKLRQAAAAFAGKPYDLAFEWSDQRIYCSELVWKIYHRGLGVRIGRLQKLGDFDLTTATVKAKMKERYGDNVPLQEDVISPGEMFNSGLLELVTEH